MHHGDPDHIRTMLRICERHRERVRGRSRAAEDETIARLRAELARSQEGEKTDEAYETTAPEGPRRGDLKPEP